MDNQEPADLAEAFQAMREHRKARRAANYVRNHELIELLGIPFETRNEGHHVIFTAGTRKFDFWPASEKFLDRETQRYGLGLFQLSKLLKGAPRVAKN